MKKIVIVAPTFNEQENIANFIEMVLLKKKDIKAVDLAILISDSRSQDKTKDIVLNIASKEPKVKYLDTKVAGPGKLGKGLFEGINYAFSTLKADAIITMEADLSNNPEQIPQFISKLATNDFVVGSRYVKGGKIVNWSWWRKMLSLSGNLLIRTILGFPKIHEFTNLYRAFNLKTWTQVKGVVKSYQGWTFVPVFAYTALDSKLKIAELPIVYYDRFGGRSKMHTVSYIKNLLRLTILYRLKGKL